MTGNLPLSVGMSLAWVSEMSKRWRGTLRLGSSAGRCDDCGVSDIGAQRYFYGMDPSQFADRYRPTQQPRPGVVVLLHGGWWGPNYGADILDGVAVDLSQHGWTVWNIEYRRLGRGGGYPSTLVDVATAIDYLATIDDVDCDRVVAVGHSAGGHLATWAAGRRRLASGSPGFGPVIDIAGVVSLAGVVDLGAAARHLSGNGAAVALMGGDPDEYPERYVVADPLSHVPIPAMVRCIHARDDDRVPFEQSVTYVRAARAAGQDATLVEVGGDHFSVADAASPTWPAVVEAIEEMMNAP